MRWEVGSKVCRVRVMSRVGLLRETWRVEVNGNNPTNKSTTNRTNRSTEYSVHVFNVPSTPTFEREKSGPTAFPVQDLPSSKAKCPDAHRLSLFCFFGFAICTQTHTTHASAYSTVGKPTPLRSHQTKPMMYSFRHDCCLVE